MTDHLARLHRTLVDATREWADVETDPGFGAPLVEDGGGFSALDGRMPFATAFRISLPDPRVRRRTFTVTISEVIP